MNEHNDPSSSEDLSFGFSSQDNWHSNNSSPIGSRPAVNPLLGGIPHTTDERSVNSSPLGGYPSQNNSVLGGYPSESNSVLGGYPSQSNSPLGGYPSQSNSVLGGYPSESNSVLGGYPSQSNSVLGGYPSQSNSPLGGYPSQSNNPLGGYPATTPTQNSTPQTSPISAAPYTASEQPQTTAQRTEPDRLENLRTPNAAIAAFVGWLIGSSLLTIILMICREWWVILPFLMQLPLGIAVYVTSLKKNRLKHMGIFIGGDAGAALLLLILRLSMPVFFGGLNSVTGLCIFLMIFCWIGFGLMIGNLVYTHKKKQRCTVPVSALCINLSRHRSHVNTTHHHGGGTTYCPTYEYYYNNEKIISERKSSSDVGVPVVGECYPLMIDPNHPQDFFEPEYNRSIQKWFIIMGAIFGFGGLWGIISMAQQAAAGII